ncbi:MAG: TonB-dependent receptor [Acidobacteria bacterium]|nr:TonB-dependent receptor [Acidobacteriota bacterium]
MYRINPKASYNLQQSMRSHFGERVVKLPNNTTWRVACKAFYFSFTASLLILLATIPALAQSFKSTLVGEVRDSRGAVIPGVTVTITQKETGRVQSVSTSADGSYSLTQLPPGRYELRVEAPNFRKVVQADLILETNNTRRINITLAVGDISETVTARDSATTIKTDTSDKGEVVTPKQVQDLPLNDRDFTALTLLVPGVYARPDEEDNGEGVAASGARTDAANYILDGVVNRSDRKNGVGVNTSVDSIREFKVATSNYSAEFGRAAGAQINVVSKSGTNNFHGSLFEYFRNDVFDAANPITGAKELRRNQFGGTIGGPVLLPKPFAYRGRDRTFFFLGYEGLRQQRSLSELATAPNEAWLRGDFRNVRGAGADGVFGNTDDTGGIIVDPLTGREFATPNVIPADRFSPTSQQILRFVPASNRPGTLSDYLAFGLERRGRNQYLARIDHNFTPTNNFYARYGRFDGPTFDPFTRDIVFPAFGRDRRIHRDSVALSDTNVFSPRFINEVRFGIYDQKFDGRGPYSGKNINTDFGIPGFESLSADMTGFPRIEIDGFRDFGDRSNDPLTYTLRNYQFIDMVSANISNHNFVFGADIIRSNYRERDVDPVRGRFRFRGSASAPNPASGNRARSTGARSFADFLLGYPERTRRLLIGSAEFADLRGWQHALFIQDGWRVRPWLTLNLGLRYELQTPLDEAQNRISNFVPEVGEVVVSGDQRFPKSLIETDKNNFAPRLGFAIRPFGNDQTVIRGGAGIYYSLETFNAIREQVTLNLPFNIQEEYNASRSSRAATAFLTFANPFPSARGGILGLGEPKGMRTAYKTPEVYQYNLTVERELSPDLALEIGYVGSQGRHLGVRYDINQQLIASDGTVSGPRPFTNCGRTSTGTTVTCGEIRFQDQVASSSYNALQTTLRRRARNGLTLLLSYTFSRSIDTTSSTDIADDIASQNFPQNSYNLRADRGLSDFHRSHQFLASFNYELPFGRGRAFLSQTRGLSAALISDWQLNGIIMALSGRPFTPQYESGSLAVRRPNLIGDPYLNIPAGLGFNPAAFSDPGNAPGSAGRNILIGPAFNTVDLSLLKNFLLKENIRLQFRAEAFNLFNHPNFGVPGFFLDNATVGRYTKTVSEGRELQFALKLIF